MEDKYDKTYIHTSTTQVLQILSSKLLNVALSTQHLYIVWANGGSALDSNTLSGPMHYQSGW